MITIITVIEQIKRAAGFAAGKGTSSWLIGIPVRKMWMSL